MVCDVFDATSCYVKDIQQPTRALGDLHLKFAEFNLPAGQKGHIALSSFTPPYIRHDPQLYAFNLRSSDCLIVATDGLWDELSTQDAVTFVMEERRRNGNQNVAEALVRHAFAAAATRNGMTVQQLQNICPGKRRKYVDDITVIVIA